VNRGAFTESKDGKKQWRGGMFFFLRAPWASAWPGLFYTIFPIFNA